MDEAGGRRAGSAGGENPGPVPDLTWRLGLFALLLRDAGLEAGPGRVADAARALTQVELGRRFDVFAGLRASFCSRREDLPVFEAAFDLFWGPARAGLRTARSPAHSRALLLDPEKADLWRARLGLPAPAAQPREEPALVHSSGYSPEELLRQKDFEAMTWEEAEQARRMLEQAGWRVAERRTRRLEPAQRGLLDLRRSARRSIHSGGELLHLQRRKQRLQRRPIVLLCDVSGSMERYSRMLILFARALTRRGRVETFVFSTRLTRVTRVFEQRDPEQVLSTISRTVQGLSGGTRIGEALHEFNLRWARRVLGHGAVVLVISDGWDRGDVEVLATEIARLRRSVHRLIWLNPLLGSENYQPLTAGMAAALPYCDDFLAVNNVAAMDQLGRLLAGLRGPGGRGRPAATSPAGILVPSFRRRDPRHDRNPSLRTRRRGAGRPA